MPHKEQLDYSGRFGLEKNDERHKKIAFTHTIIVKAILFEHFLCARHWARQWRYNTKQESPSLLLSCKRENGLYLWHFTGYAIEEQSTDSGFRNQNTKVHACSGSTSGFKKAVYIKSLEPVNGILFRKQVLADGIKLKI